MVCLSTLRKRANRIKGWTHHHWDDTHKLDTLIACFSTEKKCEEFSYYCQKKGHATSVIWAGHKHWRVAIELKYEG